MISNQPRASRSSDFEITRTIMTLVPSDFVAFDQQSFRQAMRSKERRLEIWETELQNNCACVTYDPVGARGRENLDLSNTFLMKDRS